MNRIAFLRKQAGLSQKELGLKIGAAQNSISNWENGSREPDQETIKKLTACFECTADYLLGLNTQETEKAATPKDGDPIKEEFNRLFDKLTPESKQIYLAALRDATRDR